MSSVRQIVLEEVRLDRHMEAASEQELLGLSLAGDGAATDSIGLVNLVFAIEERVQDELGVAIDIAQAGAQYHKPYRTVGTLIEFVSRLVAQASERSAYADAATGR